MIRLLQAKLKIERTWLLAGCLCLLFIATRQFTAEFWDNEWAYTLGPLKILKVRFLLNDFYLDKVYPYFIVYDTFAAPFYALFDDLTATLILRVLIWVFQIWALLRLLKTLGVRWWGAVLLVVFWLNSEQTLVAGEWIIGCASSKPVAYGFAFLSLDNALRNRLRWAGVFCGLAVSFHVVVGAWFSAALAIAVLIAQPRWRIKDLCQAGFLALICALPGLAPSVYAELSSGEAAAPGPVGYEIAKLSVLLANSWHLDPVYFMSGVEYLKLVLVFAATIWLLRRGLDSKSARLLTALIVCLAAFFVAGLLTRYWEWYRVLKYYPFRVADGVIPWAFWLGVVLALQRMWSQHHGWRLYAAVLSVPLITGAANVMFKEVLESKPHSWSAVSEQMSHMEPRVTAYWVRERGKEWYSFLFHRTLSDRDEMEQWVRGHTSEDSIFITPPWEHSFQLKAHRSQFVNFGIPVSGKIFEWKRRFEAINRGPLQGVGRELWQEIKTNYPRLTSEELRNIKNRYPVDYVLMPAGSQLDLKLVHANASYRLYQF